MQAIETRKIHRMLFIRLLLLNFVVLSAVCGAMIYLAAGNGVRHTRIEPRTIISSRGNLLKAIIVLTLAGSGLTFAGCRLAAGLAACLNPAGLGGQELRTQLIQAGKMAEIGSMSAGFAHEINNHLQVMITELAMVEVVTEELALELRGLVAEKLAILDSCRTEMGRQVKRCGEITRGLLDFARKSSDSPVSIQLQSYLPQIVEMVEQRARVNNTRIILQIEDRLGEMISDADQLRQVFVSLLNNAIDACREASRGRVDSEVIVGVRQENNHMHIHVTDNGRGFKPEDMKKAFKPFFSTKPAGQGSGLGLSTAWGIIKDLGGEISLSSELNAGSHFHIRLPISNEDRRT